MVGDFGWEHEGTECQVDTVNPKQAKGGGIKTQPV